MLNAIVDIAMAGHPLDDTTALRPLVTFSNYYFEALRKTTIARVAITAKAKASQRISSRGMPP
jgi:hypothetical protein